MQGINIANEKKRDAEVGLEAKPHKPTVHMVLSDGRDRRNVKMLKQTLDLSEDSLVDKYGDLVSVGDAIIEGNPEVDIEIVGKFLEKTRKLYMNKDNKIAYRVNLVQIVRNPDGTEKERKDYVKRPSNISVELPVQWTGKKFPKEAAIKKFVFSRKYQIRHVSGLTYDFLYDMAKDLHESKSLMLVGTGAKGNEPLVVTTGGESYRGFLEGRIDGEKYCLILHLTNMELKGLM